MEAHHDDGHKPFERKHDCFKEVHTYPYSSGRTAAFSISPSSQVLVRVVQHNNCGGLVFRPFPVAGGDMVYTAGIPWVAAAKAPDSEPASLDGAMDSDSFQRIGRAGGENRHTWPYKGEITLR
jgi:hypothetical protein